MSEFGAGHLTSEGKEALRRTVRGLREDLLVEIHDAATRAYRLSVKAPQAGLAEPERVRRKRLEDWLDEQVRTVPQKEQAGARDRFRRQAEKEAAYTLLHRIVLLRHMETLGLSKPLVVTGGWKSAGYREFRDFAPGLCHDETEGYAALLQSVFDELALDLPGLFGGVGLTELFPIAGPTLRKVVEAFDQPEFGSAWTDDTTLGWVYQFWNDPEREALDAKLNDGGKVEPHEIASKTQMFTERYMVEWLLQNSIGQTWLCMCKKHGWTADADQVLDALETRRVDWRAKREAGQVALDALMPFKSELEERWKYWVPQPLGDDAVAKAPASVKELTVLDPACGSGHFLVIAFDLLAALYREEARHRGEDWSDRQIAEWVLEYNLHGIDIDPRCVQLAAAGLWLKAKVLAKSAQPRQVNLVAPAFRLAQLPDDDPALVRLIAELQKDAGIPEVLTRAIVDGLKGVDYLGSLLKVEAAIDEHVAGYHKSLKPQPELSASPVAKRIELDTSGKPLLLERLEGFLSAHSNQRDLGLRLEGEQLAAGVRFLRIAREGRYAVVVGNPPYQGTSKMSDAKYVAKHYPRGKADLYAAFLERGLELAQDGGVSALLTMRNWMFIKQYSAIREWLLENYALGLLGDVDRGSFEEVPDEVVSAVMSLFRRAAPSATSSIAIQPTPLDDATRDSGRTKRKRAAVLCQVGRYEFRASAFEAIAEQPIVYWWDPVAVDRYLSSPKVGELFPARSGAQTSNDVRFLRAPHEVSPSAVALAALDEEVELSFCRWVPYVGGAGGEKWVDSLSKIIAWESNGLALKSFNQHLYKSYTRTVKNEELYFVPGVAFVTLGASFSARVHRNRSVFGVKGASVFAADLSVALCTLNARYSVDTVKSLNPGLDFTGGDVNRIPVEVVDGHSEIFLTVWTEYGKHAASREFSTEFRKPGPSPWRYAQDWAQRAVDRREGEPLPPYEPECDPEPPTDHLSFAVGIALGRFGANGEGILEESAESALPHGSLFLSGASDHDSLAEPAAQPIVDAWNSHGAAIDAERSLRDYLQNRFFGDVHKGMYENRPIYFPLSSAKRNFVAYVSIHRWSATTLSELLANHLLPEQRRLQGQTDDLRAARAAPDRKQAREAERRFVQVQRLLGELTDFIGKITEIAERGAPPTDSKCPAREVDAPFELDLDDGVMINSAALWPLLEPQWKDPKKWWKELCTSKGRKDYDWAHLSKRYFPERVDAKCQDDPSLGVAHGCFWKYHPAKAYAWELRLQDEIGPDFTIDEADSDDCRAGFLAEYPGEAQAIRDKEQERRDRKARKAASADGEGAGRDDDSEESGADQHGADQEGNDDDAGESEGPLFDRVKTKAKPRGRQARGDR